MSIERAKIENDSETMCKECKTFYGSEVFQGLCSSCHKKNYTSKKEEKCTENLHSNFTTEIACRKDTTDTLEELVEQPKQKEKKRCFNCSKKLGLLGIECKCGFIFCNLHRLPEEHECKFNFAEEGKKKLEKEIVKVSHVKVTDF